MLLVVGDVFFNSEAPQFEICWLSLSEVRIGVEFSYLCSYERVCVHIVSVYVVLCNSQKKEESNTCYNLEVS
jgi:hypothetical protein